MNFGELLSSSWKEYKENFRLYAKLIFLFVFIPSILILIVSQYLLWQGGWNVADLLYVSISSVLGIAILFIGILASVGIYASALFGKKSYNNALDKGKSFYWKYIGFNIIAGIFLVGLFLLPIIPIILIYLMDPSIIFIVLLVGLSIPLIFPGIIFAIYWTFAVFVLIAENKGIIDSLKESYRLVKKRWWMVFGYSLLFMLVFILIGIVFSIPSWPTGIWLAVDVIRNPTLYVEDAVPTTISIIHSNISEFMDLLAKFVIIPLSILFYKNFYLGMKKGKDKKK